MKGYVPTPLALVDQMVSQLFADMPPRRTDYLLDPGCGEGTFIDGVLRWCNSRGIHPPHIIGVELNPSLALKARRRFNHEPMVEVVNADYLVSPINRQYRFVVGNPPYVSLEHISENHRERYRKRYTAAHGRFDLYMLFFEKAINELIEGGRLIYVTPEKYLYVESASPLRQLMTDSVNVESIEHIPESTFSDHTTYPVVTTLQMFANRGPTQIYLRSGEEHRISLPGDGTTWLPSINRHQETKSDMVPLNNYCLRISAGVATGADAIYIRPIEKLSNSLKRYSYPAVAGRDLSLSLDTLPIPKRAMLVPYDSNGKLLPEMRLGALGLYLHQADNHARLMERTCTERKPWYAFHDNCPLLDIRRPKILCKDIGQYPKFWADRTGTIIPLHSVYYIVPLSTEDLDPLCDWLNGPEVATWLTNHCQKAANGFIRLQSHVLRNLPVPASLVRAYAQRVA